MTRDDALEQALGAIHAIQTAVRYGKVVQLATIGDLADNAERGVETALSSPCACGDEEPLAVAKGWIASDDIDRPRDAHPVFPRFSPSAYYKSDIPVRIIILPGGKP